MRPRTVSVMQPACDFEQAGLVTAVRADQHLHFAATRQSGTPSNTAPIEVILDQLAHILTALDSAAEHMLQAQVPSLPPESQFQPHARKAATLMHQLRKLQLAPTPSVTELSQRLTVVVLLADLITSGQILSAGNAAESYHLLQRNVQQALRHLQELRDQQTGAA